MRVLFVNPPIRLPRTFAHYPTFSSLGMLWNAAWLRQQGHDVAVIDALSLPGRLVLRDDGGGFRHVGAEVADVVEAVAEAASGEERPCIIVAVTMFTDLNRLAETTTPELVEALGRAVPRASIGLADLHICGMNYFSWDVEAVMSRLDAVHWALVGEGEPTLPALVERLERDQDLAGLPRTARRDRDGIVRFEPRAPEPLPDLDVLPLPAFDLLDMDRWFAVQAEAIEADLVHEYHEVERQIPFMTSRGCPHRCRFCTNQVLALPWRAHSVGWVRRAVRELRARWRPDRLMLLDDNINVRRERFVELTRLFAEEGMAWDAVNGLRADHLDLQAIRDMKRVGNRKITVSAESGDPQVLRKLIRKGLRRRAVIDVAKMCRQERMPLQVHYILGVPGETIETINKTLEMATELWEREAAWPLLQHAIPFPGTEMARDVEEHGWYAEPPETISGAVLEERSIIRTPELDPGAVITMKRLAQHLHEAERRVAYLEVESRCDQDCLACLCHGDGDARMGRETLRAAMEEARWRGAREIVLGGGEPTLRADLPEIVAEARGLGFEVVTLVTNAHGLARADRAKVLLDAGIDRMLLGLHAASAEEHDAVTRVEGSWRLTLAGLKRATALGLRSFEVHVSVTRANLSALPAAARLAVKLGARAVHLMVPAPDSPAAAHEQIPHWNEARPALAKALDAARPGVVRVQGAPLCLWPERPGALTPSPPWELRRIRSLRAKLTECRKCTHLLLCGGFWRPEHLSLYGVSRPRGPLGPHRQGGGG